MADPKKMYSTSHIKKKGGGKFELLLIILLLLTIAFLSIPIINSITNHKNEPHDNNNEYLDDWNRGLDFNTTEEPVNILKRE